jgi:hypothetical protein
MLNIQKHDGMGKLMLRARQNMPVQGRNLSGGLCFCNTKSKLSSTIAKRTDAGDVRNVP